MLALSTENVEGYLRERGWVHGSVRVELLGGGVSNLVFRIEDANGRFILKQSCPQLRVADPWFSDLDRVFREQAVLEFLQPLLPADAISTILQRDDANYCFAMTHAPAPATDWRTTLLAGEADVERAAQAGEILGRIHAASALQRDALQSFADRTVFHQLRTDPFYRRVSERVPDMASAIAPLIERVHEVSLGLCHGDFSPKNLLQHPHGLTLVDHETACLGDPAFDLGFFLSHLTIKAIHLDWGCIGEREPMRAAFLQRYRIETGETWWQAMAEWGIRHEGACILARVDGTSPVPYLRDVAKKDRLREVGRRLLTVHHH